MNWQELVTEVYKRTTREVEQILGGLSVEDLHKRPSPGANPVGWLLWHAARSMDRVVGDCILGEQLWVSDGWHKRFGLPPDPQNTGYGHSDAQVSGLRIPDAGTLLDYHYAVMNVMLGYLESVPEDELAIDYPCSVEPGLILPVHARITSNIHDIQHVGQAGYVRGLIKGHGWYGK